jgi:hypothetical protein
MEKEAVFGANERVPKKLRQRAASSNHPCGSLAAEARKQVKQQRRKRSYSHRSAPSIAETGGNSPNKIAVRFYL